MVVPVPLEPLENLHREIGGNRIGRTQVGLCPPFDSSPLGDLTAFLRVAIQSSDEQTAQKYLRAFNELLITPLKSAGIDTERHKRWIVVPHGPLHYLPFAALLDDAGKFLIEKVSVTISPSASIWLRKQKQSLGQPKVVLGLFAPKFTNTHSEALASPEQEIKALKAVSQGVTAQLYQDSSATEGKLREYGPKAIIVHLSTHGDFPERNAMDFHEVLLTPEDKDDGRLQAHEIRSLDLSNTALVTLSICNGGLYNVGPGDEPYGLIPAFLASGAKNVVATLFPLEDKFGRDFMTRFYGHLTKDGPATALQETMKSLIKEEELIHRWAAFVNVGPGRLFPLQQ